MELTSVNKYLFKPFYGSSHFWSIKWLEKLPNKTALDIGSGSGNMGKILNDLNYTSIEAVEPDSSANEIAKNIYSHVYTNYYDVKKTYDLILILDVLEHLSEPEKEFHFINTLLNKDGYFVISVPNITNIFIRISIFFGYFEYQNRGLLDRTHLQFFTQKRLKKMIESQENLTLKEQKSSIPPLEFLVPELISKSIFFKLFSKFHQMLANLFPNLFAYQHLVLIQKHK